MRGGGFDKSTVATVLRGSIECAANIHGTGLHVAHQADRARHILHGARFDDAGVVDDSGAECIGGLGRHEYLPAIGLNQLFILGQRVE